MKMIYAIITETVSLKVAGLIIIDQLVFTTIAFLILVTLAIVAVQTHVDLYKYKNGHQQYYYTVVNKVRNCDMESSVF